LILKYQAGHGTVDLDEASSRHVPVEEIPCLALHSVAEFAVMMILALDKEFAKAYNDTRKQVWLPDLQPSLTTQTHYAYNWVNLAKFDSVHGKTVGLVGLGTVGKAVAKLLGPFRTKILYTDVRRLNEAEEQELGVKYVALEELLRQSDFVSLHLRLNEDTEKLIGEREFAMMKPSAFFINTSRGRVVDEDALHHALSSGRIAGAALDVFRMEPLPSDSPLWQLENVIITPHVAGIPVANTPQREAEMIAESIAKYSD
jgi:phosphoglycerate dehydrogenase-like enzyme